MYNVKVKKDYIKYNPNNNHNFEQVMANYFDRAEMMEKRLKKDLALFTSAEIIQMYKGFVTPSFSMLVVINNQFLNYTTWYLREVENIDNQNHYMEMRDDILMNCVSFSAQKSNVLSRENVLEITKQFANPYESFLFLALFEGIKGEMMSDYYDLSMKDFDKDNLTVNLPNRKLTISRELYYYAEAASTEYVIYNIYGEPTKRGRLLEEDKRIIKCSASVGFESDSKERVQIVYRMLRKIKRYDFVPASISATALIESGRINMICEYMHKLNTDNAENVLRQNKKEIEERYGMIPSVPKWLLRYESFCKR